MYIYIYICADGCVCIFLRFVYVFILLCIPRRSRREGRGARLQVFPLSPILCLGLIIRFTQGKRAREEEALVGFGPWGSPKPVIFVTRLAG